MHPIICFTRLICSTFSVRYCDAGQLSLVRNVTTKVAERLQSSTLTVSFDQIDLVEATSIAKRENNMVANEKGAYTGDAFEQ